MRQESDVEQAIAQYADMIRHICLVYIFEIRPFF